MPVNQKDKLSYISTSVSSDSYLSVITYLFEFYFAFILAFWAPVIVDHITGVKCVTVKSPWTDQIQYTAKPDTLGRGGREGGRVEDTDIPGLTW